MIIKLATKNDINDIMEIIIQRCNWFIENNITQWTKKYYTRKYNHDYFIKMINTNNLYVAKENNETIGVFLLKTEDKIYWKDNAKAYYIHHLATKVGYPGIGAKMLEFIENLAKNNMVKYIRLDCFKENVKLNNYYKKSGFVNKGEGIIGSYYYNLWEKTIY